MTTPTVKKEQAQQHASAARESAGQAADKAREAAGQAGQAIQTAAGAATQAVQNAASSTAHAVGQKAEQATSAVGHGMQSLADTVRHQGPESGFLGQASHAVADTLDQTGRYIEDRNLSGMMDDVTDLIKRNPIPALLFGLGVGFLLGRALRR
jgi:hypothetical protein